MVKNIKLKAEVSAVGLPVDILGNSFDRKASAQDAEGRQWISDARGPCSPAPRSGYNI